MKLSQTILIDVPSHLTPSPDECPPGLQEETLRTDGVLTLFLMSDLDETSYKQDKTSSQTISLIDGSNCYITKQAQCFKEELCF